MHHFHPALSTLVFTIMLQIDTYWHCVLSKFQDVRVSFKNAGKFLKFVQRCFSHVNLLGWDESNIGEGITG